MATFGACGFKKPLDGAEVWKVELKPPGFVFSFVFPNEGCCVCDGLADWFAKGL
jgi:hypothetical protein